MTDRANSSLNPRPGAGADASRSSVSLPDDQIEQIRRLVAVGRADSVSDYVTAAVAERLERDRSLTELQDLFERKGQAPGAEHLAWAREVLGVNDDEGEGKK
ncbi:ribbon-helix-helix domain-containing protein [Glycomyces tenuis]|uniref:ribbon-helix-helix domain-containing protein n=1 Tax=Glycomyces tenuis TaxID=58116 RepID=UPI0003F4D9E8|nr:ribbon-helix-helix domain-containing protein [Glycomyces tenuis]